MTRWGGLGLVSLLLGLSACAGNPGPTQHAVFAEQMAHAIAAAQETEIGFARAGQITTEDHRTWQLGFRTIAQALQVYTQAIRAKDPVKTAGAFQLMARLLTDMSLTLVPQITDAKARATVQVALDAISAVLSQWTATVRMTWTPPRSVPSCALASS